jgi:hypothetical protein
MMGKLKYCITLLFIKRNINGEIEGVAVIAEVTPQALANQFKESEERFRPYLIMCLYTFSLLNLMKPASVTGIKLVGLQESFENAMKAAGIT